MPKALIIGDSQAQGAGSYLEKRLESMGYSVTRDYKVGGDSADVYAIAQKHPGAWDLVVVFSGSTADGAPAAKGVPSLFPKSQIVWYGSPPATMIGSLGIAQAKFGAGIKSADHWFTSGEAAKRETRNTSLPRLLPMGVRYVDWRALTLPNAERQPSGVQFPTQADGIHVLGETAAAAFAPGNWPPPTTMSIWPVVLGVLGVLALRRAL